jgi:hypothetical protein
MTQTPTIPPTFFVSYARADAEYPPFLEDLTKFVDDLSARVAVQLARPRDGVAFFDGSSIQAGTVWTSELAVALSTSQVGVALYTPNYFTRRWCGKEFQAFLDRRRPLPGAGGIVPVLWIKCTTLPPVVDNIQYSDAAFPPEYAQAGMQQLLRLKVWSDKYELALQAITNRIVAAARNESLVPMGMLDLERIRSAWEASADADPRSHTEGGVSKTCFVFVSRQGWDWKPYPATQRRIGALAQQISGELGLRYEEIPCDASLKTKLDDTNKNRVPTVVFGDPATLQLDPAYAGPMQEYDRQFLLNCAALIPWEETSKIMGDQDATWIHLKQNVFRQKIEAPPPYHEWRSIFSFDDLELKTRTAIEQLRSRLMKQILTEPDTGTPIVVRKAEDPAASSGAAAKGIQTDSPPQLEGPSR